MSATAKGIRDNSTLPYQISSVDRALTLLALIADRPHVLVSEAAEYLGTSASTAHRILQMLVHHGFVVQGERRVYRRGPAMSTLSGEARPPRKITNVAGPHVTKLRTQLFGTVHLVALEGNGARFIAGAEHPLNAKYAGLKLGWLLPAHVVAGGKALLAEMSNDSLSLLYPGGVPLTRNGRIHSLAQLKRELADVRRQGFARSHDEAEEQIAALGVALPWIAGMPRYALSVAWGGPQRHEHVEHEAITAIRKCVVELADDLSGTGMQVAS